MGERGGDFEEKTHKKKTHTEVTKGILTSASVSPSCLKNIVRTNQFPIHPIFLTIKNLRDLCDLCVSLLLVSLHFATFV